jgi:NTE family protein
VTDPIPGSTASLAEGSADFAWDGHALEKGIGLALSGGGFRAMLFHAGALLRLNEFGLLAKVQRISSVSGGSIAAGYLSLIWKKLGAPQGGSYPQFKENYVEGILAFSRQSIDVTDGPPPPSK